MSNDFNTMMAAADEHIADAFGETISYSAAGAAAVGIDVDSFDEYSPDLQSGDGHQQETQTATAIVRASEFTAEGITPAAGDVITRNSVAWSLLIPALIEGGDGYRLRLKRSKTTDRFRPGGRTNR